MTAPSQESQGHRPPVTSAGSAGAARSVTAAASETDSPEVEARAADRVIVFSDAVVAIAITLLALALPTPDSTSAWTNGQVLDSLRASWDEYFAFLISFGVIGSGWTTHRRTFRYVNRLNNQVSRLNLIWLLMMILTPFAARLLAGSGGFGVRYMIYTLIQVIAAACVVQMNREIGRENLLRADAPASARHPDNLRNLSLIVTFLVSIPVAFATHWTFALWAAIPVSSRMLRRRMTSGGWAFAPRAAVPVLPRVLRRRMTSGRHAANDADHNRLTTAAQGSGGPHHPG